MRGEEWRWIKMSMLNFVFRIQPEDQGVQAVLYIGSGHILLVSIEQVSLLLCIQKACRDKSYLWSIGCLRSENRAHMTKNLDEGARIMLNENVSTPMYCKRGPCSSGRYSLCGVLRIDFSLHWMLLPHWLHRLVSNWIKTKIQLVDFPRTLGDAFYERELSFALVVEEVSIVYFQAIKQPELIFGAKCHRRMQRIHLYASVYFAIIVDSL